MSSSQAHRRAYVIGVGAHPYQAPSDTPYTTLGLVAVRAALQDAGIPWREVGTAHVGTALVGAAVGRPMLRHLGGSGIPVDQVENASASGSTAFRQAVLDVTTGIADISLAVGVDKPAVRPDGYAASGEKNLVEGLVSPVVHFALLAERYMRSAGASPADLAAVSAKNHRNATLNPAAQRPLDISAEEVLAAPPIAGVLTKLQCCPIGEGGAAAIVASETALTRLGLDPARAVEVVGSVAMSEQIYDSEVFPDAELTRLATARLLAETGYTPGEIDLVELHDAFTVEELVYLEAMGVSEPGAAARDLRSGAFDLGGRCAVNTSGGLLAMGHPVGPTGIGQILELTTQLRGEAGLRQHPGAAVGLAHMVGVGTVCVEHLLVSGAGR